MLDWEKLTKIAEVLEMNPTDIASFDDNLIFNIETCAQSGKFETFVYQAPEKLIEQYEKRIEHLEKEIDFLRGELSKR